MVTGHNCHRSCRSLSIIAQCQRASRRKTFSCVWGLQGCHEQAASQFALLLAMSRVSGDAAARAEDRQQTNELLHSAFFRNAALYPDAACIEYRGRTYSYGECRVRAELVARNLAPYVAGLRQGWPHRPADRPGGRRRRWRPVSDRRSWPPAGERQCRRDRAAGRSGQDLRLSRRSVGDRRPACHPSRRGRGLCPARHARGIGLVGLLHRVARVRVCRAGRKCTPISPTGCPPICSPGRSSSSARRCTRN